MSTHAGRTGWLGYVLVAAVFLAGRAAAASNGPAAQQQDADLFAQPWESWEPAVAPFLQNEDRQPVRLSLEECLARALQYNLDLRVGSYDPAIRLADVTQAEAAFDAVLFGNAASTWRDESNFDSGFFTKTITTPAGTQHVKAPSDPYVQSSDYAYALGLRKRLPTGASLELAQRLRRFRTDNDALYYHPFYQWNLNLELRQPLLRDFGIDVNRASINVARNAFAISRQEFTLQVIQTVVRTEGTYWQLVFLRQQVRVLEALLREAEVALGRLEERQKLDAGAGVIARNRGLIETARADLVAARNNVLQQQDQLLQRLNDPNLPVGGRWEIIPTDPPSLTPYPFDRAEALRTGLRLRPELIAQGLSVASAAIGVGVARNQVLPRLDLVARQETTGAGLTAGAAWDTQRGYDTINYQAALSFELPLGNRAAEAALVQARQRRRQEELRLASFREQVLADVSLALSELEHTHREIADRRLAAQAEGDTLRSYLAQESTDAKITADFLNRKLDAQERLAQAQIRLAQTIFQYNLAILNAHRAQGTLLHYDHVKLEELPSP